MKKDSKFISERWLFHYYSTDYLRNDNQHISNCIIMISV